VGGEPLVRFRELNELLPRLSQKRIGVQLTITPCQFGGKPDCTQCGCMASAGLKAVGDHRILGVFPVRAIYEASDAIGKRTARMLGPVRQG